MTDKQTIHKLLEECLELENEAIKEELDDDNVLYRHIGSFKSDNIPKNVESERTPEWREKYCKTCVSSMTMTLDTEDIVICRLINKKVKETITHCNRYIKSGTKQR
jgi:hypothetical protein